MAAVRHGDTSASMNSVTAHPVEFESSQCPFDALGVKLAGGWSIYRKSCSSPAIAQAGTVAFPDNTVIRSSDALLTAVAVLIRGSWRENGGAARGDVADTHGSQHGPYNPTLLTHTASTHGGLNA